jgi:hypothetical protein
MTPFIDVAMSDRLAGRGRRMGATQSLVTKHVGVADAGLCRVGSHAGQRERCRDASCPWGAGAAPRHKLTVRRDMARHSSVAVRGHA